MDELFKELKNFANIAYLFFLKVFAQPKAEAITRESEGGSFSHQRFSDLSQFFIPDVGQARLQLILPNSVPRVATDTSNDIRSWLQFLKDVAVKTVGAAVVFPAAQHSLKVIKITRADVTER